MSPSPRSHLVAVVPLRRGVLLPGSRLTVPVGRPRSVATLRAAGVGGLIAVASQRDPEVEVPGIADLHPIATLARIIQVVPTQDGGLRAVLEGLTRVSVEDLGGPEGSAGRVVEVEEAAVTREAELYAAELARHATELAAERGVELPDGLLDAAPTRFADQVAAILELEPERRRAVLEELDPRRRLELVAQAMREAKELWDLRRRIGSEVRRELGREQRKALLHQQIKALRRELEGEEEDAEGAAPSLADRLRALELPDEVRTVVDRELARLERLGPQHAEHGVVTTYLEFIADLPWTTRAPVLDDVAAVQRRLDEDHWGLEEPKRHIAEALAVTRLTGEVQGTLLCFVGPPGVGKTSLAQSVADATGRPLVRVALGGVRDEAEIRGHRRTYVGALPGRILSALRKAKVRNPVVVLDEIDKLGHGVWGSPEAALLELLDPEQNRAFTDHYLELPFDLSEVMFIATANTLDTLSAPLRDRLEVIHVSGYTLDEKLEIARRHLLPKQLRKLGLQDRDVQWDPSALVRVTEDYTRESGVRQLERELRKLLRAVALDVVRGGDAPVEPVLVDAAEVRRRLGKPKVRREMGERAPLAGVATGLAWTPTGGDILFVETSRMPGKGQLQITGQLGEVMQESARAALTYVRSNAVALGVAPDFLETHDVHIHVPAGATPKDGPSAGVTIFTAFTSLLTGRPVRGDTAMTGECSLRGRVLPVGGIKEKVIAAHRAGLRRVILPRGNEADLDEVPAKTLGELEVVLVDEMAEVLDAALDQAGSLEVATAKGPERSQALAT